MLTDVEEFVVGVEAEATKVEEGIFFFGLSFFLAAFAKPVVGCLGCCAAFGFGGIKPVAAGGGATTHSALGPSWGAAPMGGMPVGSMADDPSMGTMPMAATWERSGQRTAPAAPAVDAMGGGLQ